MARHMHGYTGKSTLLDVLAGRVNGRKVRGSITMSGHPTTPAMRRRLCGYVLQDDVMPGALSVPSHSVSCVVVAAASLTDTEV